ncbi:MAG: RluA family pseudouridine synthase [Herpetosiphonaceae bacterium]|nr:RluA family pseudouridine synthase [Herpetosiphonaceae bacterium]
MTDTPDIQSYTVAASHHGDRLDRWVAATVSDLSRSYAQQLIADGHIVLNGVQVKPSMIVATGDTVQVTLPLPQPSDLVPEDLPLIIRYEDDDLLVVDKAAGMVVHPAPGHARGTLVNALLFHYPTLQIGSDLRPGIVHRLDRDTSGLLVVAKHDRAKAWLQTQQQAHTMDKIYLALIEGHFNEPTGVIDAPLDRHPTDRLRQAIVQDGRQARTHYRELERLGSYSLLEVRLETGRTHQIRVHFAHKHHPVASDPLYGRHRTAHPLGLTRQFLHAHSLSFNRLDGQRLVITSPLPPDLQTVLDALRLLYATSAAPPAGEQPWWATDL